MSLVEGAPAIMDQHLGSSPANFGIQQAGSNRKFEFNRQQIGFEQQHFRSPLKVQTWGFHSDVSWLIINVR